MRPSLGFPSGMDHGYRKPLDDHPAAGLIAGLIAGVVVTGCIVIMALVQQ